MDAPTTGPTPPTCAGCAERDRKIAQLEARIAALEALARSAKRQAAPFSKGPPKANPKKPGRKSGDDYGTHQRRAVPQCIDEVHEAPLPESCPRCGGAVDQTSIEQQYQTEIPRKAIHRQFNVHVGVCSCCKKRVQGRHALQTSDALGAAASQIGPDAQALSMLLNKEAGLSHGKISRFFGHAFDMVIGRATPCRTMLRTAERCGDAHLAIIERVQSSPTIVPDETGWRIGGLPAWLHVAVGIDATLYLVDRHRGYDAAVKLIGQDYAGVMTHDGWKPYLRFEQAVHQTCLGHLLRRCNELLEDVRGGARIFPLRVKSLLQEGLSVRDRRDGGELSIKRAAKEGLRLNGTMQDLLCRPRSIEAHRIFANHLWNNRDHLFVFLDQPGIDATNHRSEQAIRPSTANRKVCGGNRTENGAWAQGVLLSVTQTARQQGVAAMDFISRTLRSLPGLRPRLFPDST
jgi:transposase